MFPSGGTTAAGRRYGSVFRRFLRHERLIALAFFAVLLCVGLLVFEHYGVPWDEPNMVKVGDAAYDYVFRGHPWPSDPAQRYYGPAVEFLLMGTVNLLGVTVSRDIYLVRHLGTFLLFFLGVVFFYLLVRRVFRSDRAGLLGAVMLVLSPRIFADAFYNSKDIPNLTLFIIGMYTLLLVLERPTWKRTLAHVLASALVVCVRITGILIPAFTVLFLGIRLLCQWRTDRTFPRRESLRFGVYVLVTPLLIIAFWPFLWQKPVGHFLEAYHFMSTIGVDTFYMGRQITSLPWHYAFVWIGITTPVLYTLLFLIGLAAILLAAARHPVRWLTQRTPQALFLLWFFLPIVMVLLTGAGIFDGWRHLFFVYPAFLLIALHGVRLIAVEARIIADSFPKHRTALCAALLVPLVAQLGLTGIWMIRNHPFQNVYFSIPASLVDGKFELDYWGLSYRQAIEAMLRRDPAPVIPIHATSFPGYAAIGIMREEDAKRIEYKPIGEAKYSFTNYRPRYGEPYPYAELDAIRVDGIKILGTHDARKPVEAGH